MNQKFGVKKRKKLTGVEFDYISRKLKWQPLKDALCNPELPFEIISEILKPILDRHGYSPALA